MDERLLKARARESLAGNWPLAIGVAALAVILGGLGAHFLPNDIHDFPIPLRGEWTLVEGFSLSLKNGIFSLCAFLIGGVLDLGYSLFALNLHDRKEAEFSDLFSQFHRFTDGFLQQLLRYIYVALWSLLLVIPGLIAHYSYAMTPYLMLDHPDLTPSQAIAASKQLMNGHKGELFTLRLSMFGWFLLSLLTMNLGFLALNPYIKLSEAAFYRQLTTQ